MDAYPRRTERDDTPIFRVFALTFQNSDEHFSTRPRNKFPRRNFCLPLADASIRIAERQQTASRIS